MAMKKEMRMTDQEILSLPDESIDMAELEDYGYHADDMYPLRQETALKLHQMGEKIYCLQRDGSKGEYASREMILAHEGIYGIEKFAWQSVSELKEDYYEEMEGYGSFASPMAEISREDALKYFDAGETVYLITVYQRPVAVQERKEIERGAEYFQMDQEELDRIKGLEKQMWHFSQIRSLKEANLLLGTENRYGIYQIADGTAGENYRYLNMAFIEREGYHIQKEDYKLVYTDDLWYGETLDSLFEKFNMDQGRPEGFTGHSLSVSDVIVLNENGSVKAYFVDSISFQELPDFLHLEPVPDQVLTGQVRSGGEYKPLAKVEELEEANYNMIDNVLNNMPPKKGPYLEYYAAECLEFHELGVYYQSDNLDEIISRYREILNDPAKVYGGNGMGIICCSPEEPVYDKAEVDLVSGRSIHGEHLDHVPFIAVIPEAYETVERIRDAFPDFRYYAPKDIREHLYPENMTADELAAAMMELVKDFDFHDGQEYQESEEDQERMIALELRCGEAYKYVPYLKDMMDDGKEESLRAEVLLGRLRSYQPEISEQSEPVVQIDYCEDSSFHLGSLQKLSELDGTVSRFDADLSAKVDSKTGNPEKTVRMYFTLYYPDGQQMKKLQGKINIGEGTGGIIGQLKAQNEMKLTDESWLEHQKSKGAEEYQAYMSDLTDMQERVLPYLQSYCSPEERMPDSINDAEKSLVAEGKGSIHERLKINKEIIAKQQGKGYEGKGAEL